MPKYTFTCWDKNRASLWNTDVIEFASAADAKAHAEKLARSYARQGRVVEVSARRFSPAKLAVEWSRDGQRLSIYPAAGGKKMITVRYDPLFHKDHHDAVAPFMRGWFKSDNPDDFRYRVVFR